MKPPKRLSEKDSSNNDSFNLDQSDINLAHIESQDISKDNTETEFFKNNEENSNSGDGDESTTLSSSPICKHRKSLF